MDQRPRVPYQGYPYTKPVITDAVSSGPASLKSLKNNPERLPYQGFPYVNPIVTDAPSLNPAEVAALAKWQNLPRRPIAPNTTDGAKSPTSETASVKSKGSHTSNEHTKAALDPDRPIVYIDIPQGSSGVTDRSPDQERGGRFDGATKELDPDRPVVYIDIPDNNGSEVSQSIEEEEPAYVQETILYDPFKNRRIELPRDSDSEGFRSLEPTTSPGSTGSRPGQARPRLPNIECSGSSGICSANSSLPSSYNNTYLSKETSVYGQTPTSNDEFPLSPLPVSDFPAYPPPYEEIEQTQTRPQPVAEQPRTQVITTVTPISPPESTLDERRKLVTCQHCNATVQTLVVEENGFTTHVIAFLVCMLALPLVICVYFCGFFKYKNHYCPHCNERIAYQNPIICSDHLTYIS